MKMLHPESRKIVFWNGLLILSILYNCVVIPFQFFTKFVLIPPPIAFLFDLVSDLIFILDIYLRFNTGYVVRGEFIDDRRQIRQRYLQSWFWRHYSELFESIGLPIYQPVAGCSEIINILKSKRDEIIFKMKLTSKEETEILAVRLEKLERKIIKLEEKKFKKPRKVKKP